MSDPAVAPNPAMTANAKAWTVPENWDGDNYAGPGLPPWGTKQRCPVIRNGRRCRKACIPGGTVCNTHGGAAPQVRNKAKLRLLSLVDPALSTLARTMVDQNASLELKTKIAFGILDRTGLGKAGDMDANTAKAVLMERYYALREQLETEREEAGLPPIDVEWQVVPDPEYMAPQPTTAPVAPVSDTPAPTPAEPPVSPQAALTALLRKPNPVPPTARTTPEEQ